MKPFLPVVLVGMLIFSGIEANSSRAGLIDVDGAIGPATADFIDRATRVSAESGDECLILRLDTPGGLLDSTKSIVQSIYSSEVPVVVFVAPSGANAGSAGCFITLAADVAAMAPNPSIGAAHPIAFGVTGDAENADETVNQKLENFAVSYIETIAEKRRRNVEWARSAVRESASITSEKALELNVVEIIALDVDHLLSQLDGREVKERALKTAQAEVVEIPMLLRERRAKIINAEGEFQAADKLVQAGAKISTQPVALQLRFLQTIREISSEHNTNTIVPLPIDLISPFLKAPGKPVPEEKG